MRGDLDEVEEFRRLQRHLVTLFDHSSGADPPAVVVVPSLTLNTEELRKITGAIHFEERLLSFAQLLRSPRARMVYVTSESLSPAIVDYVFGLLPSLPVPARRFLTLLDCADGSARPLTQKILDRPQVIDAICRAIPDRECAYLVTYNSTPLERTLAVRLGIPLYACDPDLFHLGSKSGGRQLLRDAGVPVPEGFEDIRDEQDAADALTRLKEANPQVSRAVIKLNDSFAGGGNAVFPFAGAPDDRLASWVAAELPRRLEFAAGADTWDSYLGKLREMGGVVERFVDTPGTFSPSAQLEITPDGTVHLLSTHDQVLGGRSGQVFTGCTFPASRPYRLQIQQLAIRAGKALATRGVLGQLSIDFVTEPADSGWRAQALEINLRMGGATAPYFVLHALAEGQYDQHVGEYLTPEGEPRYYVASDRLQSDAYRSLDSRDVIDIAYRHRLHFRHTTRDGVAFYMLGALADAGKLGMVAIASTTAGARDLYGRTLAALEAEMRVRR